MKFKHKYEWRTEMQAASDFDIVGRAVIAAGYAADSEIETLRQEVRCLTEIVGMLVTRLPEEDLIEVAEALQFERL